MECYTPIEAEITRVLNYGEENEILIRVGDRTWLPSEAAGSTDKEKEHYLPGIWDDVFISFTGKFRIDRVLLLPNLKEKKIKIKARIRSFYPPQLTTVHELTDDFKLHISIYEKKSGDVIASTTLKDIVWRDNYRVTATSIEMPGVIPWTPDNPFLYEAKVKIYDEDQLSDVYTDHFGMRDFTRKGKYFYLNGKKTFLRGGNITLHRFFEDPDCEKLPWDTAWVKKLLIDRTRNMHWNAMRICVGIVPDFWYDIADEHGILLQNEWLYWMDHGWDEQIRKEFTNWVWSDGNHPSIVIWDAMNENKNDYIGNQLIPELMELDPTRIWDAGYMTSEDLTAGQNEMDEPHNYEGPLPWGNFDDFKANPYPLGNLDYRNHKNIKSIESSAAQITNEYGMVWLWRNGKPAKLTVDFYKYYLGENTTTEERRHLQAYWLQLDTEWLRSIRQHAGVLAFCYLTNNYGYTGDWFINDIADLEPGPAMKWFRHAFAPASVFINLADNRYVKHIPPYKPGSVLNFSLAGVNDNPSPVKGIAELKLLNSKGKVVQEKTMKVSLPTDIRKEIPVSLNLPEAAGGYTMVAEFLPDGRENPIISRRYIKIGAKEAYKFFDLEYPAK